MKRRIIILYWILLLAPTLLISVGAMRLLRHEQERLATREREVLAAQVQTLADDIQLTVAGIRDETMAGLQRIDPEQPVTGLIQWQAQHPLLRHTFLWTADGLSHPAVDRGRTVDETRFVERYARLFAGEQPWQVAGRDVAAPLTQATNTPVQRGRRVANLKQQFTRLRSLNDPYDPQRSPRQQDRTVETGWIPWFEDNALCLLGWLSRDGRTTVMGVELEMSALVSRLPPLFPPPRDDLTLALLDDGGRIVHQAGPIVPDNTMPSERISLAPDMPHWEVVAYLGPEGLAPAATGMFLVVSGLLLAIFVAAILVGGVLLTWQALRSARDARRKTTFVSNVSHELKTPLTSIRMYAELLKEKRVIAPDRQARYLDVITAESQRLTRLVNNMLDFSRLEQGRKRYRPERLDLGEVLRQFASSHALRIAEAGMTLATDIPDAPVVVVTDRDAVEQAVLNLVDNAIKYAATGQVLDLAVATTDAGHVTIRVMDRGPGVRESQQELVFEQFRRGDDSLTAQQPGSGLGLSIARNLMRALGGDIVYRPREGGGSVFEVRL